MRRRGKRWMVVVAILMGVAAAVVLLRLRRDGYLPTPVTVTAEPAPTSIPLPTPTAAPTGTVRPSPQPTPVVEPPSADATVAPTPRPTRVVLPPEPLALPAGFVISIYAEGLSGPRMMALDANGVLYVAERGARRIVRLPDVDGDGVADGILPVAVGLNAPSSIAFAPDGSLYVGETTRVLRLSDPDASGSYGVSQVIVSGLPEGGHNTRTLLFSADGATLFVSVGSSCNVCEERDPRRAAVVAYTPMGEGERIYAGGLRNAVGLALRPGTAELWVTNNGRDWLGDDQPPETIYLIQAGDDAGWPRCHSGRIVDPEYGYEGACEGVLSPMVEMQAHTAPLGLTFYAGAAFPEEYQGDLFVALHGSWNRSRPVGYQVIRVPVDETGRAMPAVDFVTGWLREDGTQWGRPVDVLTGADGSLFISDDGGGRIYRVFYAGASE